MKKLQIIQATRRGYHCEECGKLIHGRMPLLALVHTDELIGKFTFRFCGIDCYNEHEARVMVNQ